MVAPYLQGRDKGETTRIAGLVSLLAILLIPTLLPEKTGWLTSLIPLPVFYYLVSLGKKDGLILLRNAIFLAAGGSLLFGSLPILIFSLTFVPLGVALSYGVYCRRSPVATGFIGSLVLALTWLLYWSGLTMVHQANPYGTLLLELDKGLRSGLLLYEDSAQLSPETLESIRLAVELLRVNIPKILPGMLFSGLLCTVWLNLVLGFLLLKRKKRELIEWPEYVNWALPEQLVWVVILSGIFFGVLPKPLNIIGLNGLIICGTVYFFQGLAIAASLLNRWSVPRLIRFLIYALIFIQTYGIIVLSFLGLLDVWADFRKLNQAGDNRNSGV